MWHTRFSGQKKAKIFSVNEQYIGYKCKKMLDRTVKLCYDAEVAGTLQSDILHTCFSKYPIAKTLQTNESPFPLESGIGS